MIESDSEDDVDDIVELGADGFDISEPKQHKELDMDDPSMKAGLLLKEEGNGKFKAKEYAAAIQKYQEALEKLPEGAPASVKASVHGNAATCQFYLQQFDKAVAFANSSLRFDKKYVKALYRRGLSHQALGAFDQASKDLRKALKYDPENKQTRRAIQQLKRQIKEKEMPTITKKASLSKADRLRLSEVQEAMNGTQPAADFLKEKQGEWHTPDLMERLSKNPRIVAGMKNPYYMQVMQELQSNPTEAMKKCQSDPGLKDFIQEWMGLMGGHFEKLGEKEEEKKKEEAQKKATKEQREAVGTNPITGKEIRWDTLPAEAKNTQADEQVQKILGNEELANLLNDPEMHKVLQACGHPGQLQRYMSHPEWGPKLKMMQDAGLVQIQK